MSGWGWTVHGDGRTVRPGEVVAPDERLSWGRTIGIGMQHVVAMFGATFLVPLLTDFSPQTTLFFSALGTALFLLVTRNRLPSYLGSSFAFIAPVVAATASGGQSVAVGGILVTGLALFVVGLVAHLAGTRWIDVLMPPVVTGTIVALIGFNLAPAAWGSCDDAGVCSGFRAAPVTATATLLAIVLVTVLFRGLLGRLSILVGVLVGYGVALLRGEVDLDVVREAAWVGLPPFVAPTFEVGVLGLFLPVVLVLVAENVGHVKSVAAMTDRDLDPLVGRALMADGLATTLAGTGGGSGTTTYAENIGVMAASRVYSTAAYWVAAATALVLALSPKFGALVATIPPGVLGGAAAVLYGMIGLLGARIWVQNRVDFSAPVNLMPAAVALIVGVANFTWDVGELKFEGIAIGTAAAIGLYHLMRGVARWRGTHEEPATPASVPGGDEIERGRADRDELTDR
ncbi:uracil-xanthine permease family protein [Cellulomonas xiejunii]|uniref:NCS2 family nucleobase:cation symporter n=1 Tax=Cellulomonas xiejunii TaxID=2968083 RepID=A0ABY5KLH3_9CELL|nr:solute carrier family 23 protein [Cellulomonas xiejunii]MCC2319702.1 NCS2 family nucleobase:cation symporter [Cellulomonas xiejunii]UUI71359.1 NCS2 family nucleobase:cation symporter [Cellulomonas xiejunii]